MPPKRATCFERSILFQVSQAAKRRLQVKDLLEWSTAPIAKRAGEVLLDVTCSGVKIYVAIPEKV